MSTYDGDNPNLARSASPCERCSKPSDCEVWDHRFCYPCAGLWDALTDALPKHRRPGFPLGGRDSAELRRIADEPAARLLEPPVPGVPTHRSPPAVASSGVRGEETTGRRAPGTSVAGQVYR